MRVIDEPMLSKDVGARCLKKSPPIPSTGDDSFFTLECVARRDHARETHVAFTAPEQGVTTWLEWDRNEGDREYPA